MNFAFLWKENSCQNEHKKENAIFFLVRSCEKFFIKISLFFIIFLVWSFFFCLLCILLRSFTCSQTIKLKENKFLLKRLWNALKWQMNENEYKRNEKEKNWSLLEWAEIIFSLRSFVWVFSLSSILLPLFQFPFFLFFSFIWPKNSSLNEKSFDV